MQELQENTSNVRAVRIQKLADLADKGINPYPYSYEKDASAKQLQDKYKDLPTGEETEDVYHVAGRIMAIRNTGMFIDLQDASGKIQVFSENLKEILRGTFCLVIIIVCILMLIKSTYNPFIYFNF